MDSWFDNLTKTLGDVELSRRQMIRRISGTVTGMALALWFPETGLAQEITGNHCSKPCNFCDYCSIALNCSSNNINCYCLTRLNNKSACVCNGYCSSFSPCAKESDCPGNSTCIIGSGCGCSGFCMPNCTTTCHPFDSGGSGRTAVPIKVTSDR